MAGDDLGAEGDLDPVEIALDHELLVGAGSRLVGVDNRRGVVLQPIGDIRQRIGPPTAAFRLGGAKARC